MKILFDFRVYQFAYNNGIGRYVYTLLKYLLEIDSTLDITILLKKDREVFPTFNKKYNIKYLFIEDLDKTEFKEKFDYWFFDDFLCVSKSTDIKEHFSTLFPEILLSNVNQITGIVYDFIPLVFPNKNTIDFNALYLFQIETLKMSNFLFTISNFTKHECVRFLNRSESDFININGGVDSDIFNNHTYNFKKRKNYIITVNINDMRKNPQSLIDGFCIAYKNNKIPLESKLYICGKINHNFKKYLLYRIEKYNIDKNLIIFTDFINDTKLVKLISEAKALFFPSFYEGLGLPVLESYACGTPAFASNKSSTKDLVLKECSFNPYNVNEIAEKIVEAFNNENLCSKSLTFGKKLLKNDYNWKNSAKIVLNELKSRLFHNNFPIIQTKQNITKNSPKILHYSTYNVQCGIATFLNDFINGLEENNIQNNDIIPIYSDIRKNIFSYVKYLDILVNNFDNYDYIILQHEYSLYVYNNIILNIEYKEIDIILEKINLDKKFNCSSGIINSMIFTDYIITNALRKNKKISIVWHTTFKIAIEDFKNIKVKINFKNLPVFRYFNNKNLQIFVMTNDMIEVLKENNIPTDNVTFISHPIPTNIFKTNNKLKKKLISKYNIKSNDIILGSFGFVCDNKGNMKMLKAMKYLPNNYKYIMIGGKHPSDSSTYFDDIVTYIKDNKLQDRIFITGFIEEQDLSTYINIVDLAVYLYNTNINFASGSINQMFLYGVPALASDGISFKDLKKKYNCLEITKNDNEPKLLSQDIINLINDKDKIQILKDNMKVFCENNTFKNFINKILGKLYE